MAGLAILFVGASVLGIGPGLVVGRMLWNRTDPNRSARHALVIITVVAALTLVCVTGISFALAYWGSFPRMLGRALGFAVPAGVFASLVLAFGFFVDLSITRSRASKPERSDRTSRSQRRTARGRIVASVVGAFIMLFFGTVPQLLCTRVGANESFARLNLRFSASAQATFRWTDFYEIGKHVFANPVNGRGFADLYEFELARGAKRKWPKLISAQMSEASANGKGKPYAGYYYIDITGTREGPYDYTKEFGLCAFPALYDKSGVNTYIIDVSGTIYYKDTGGTPATTWPDVEAEGWAKLPASVH